MSNGYWQQRKELSDVGKRIWKRGYCAGNEGNHSMRIGPDRVLCTPTGVSKGFISPDEICVVDMDGTQVEENTRGRKRTSEVLVHLAIYKHRDDVKAVIHSHPPHATAFCISDMALPEGIHPEAEVFLGRVPRAHYATPSTQALPDSLLPLIGPETNTVLMGNHGTVSFSDKGLIDAYYKLEILDAYCRILLLAAPLGRINPLSQSEMAELLQVKEKFGFRDERAACVEEGCVGEFNESFLAGTDVRPVTASCQCAGGPVTTSVADGAVAADLGDDLEPLVAAITDQIMARVG